MDIKELRARYKAGERAFQDLDFSSQDLSFFDLSNADFSRGKLWRVNLRSATLVGANFSNCDLTFADLSSADLTNTNLSGADLSGANLSGSTIKDVVYSNETRFPIGVAIGEKSVNEWQKKQMANAANQASGVPSQPSSVTQNGTKHDADATVEGQTATATPSSTNNRNDARSSSKEYLWKSISQVYNDHPRSFEQFAVKVSETADSIDRRQKNSGSYEVTLGESTYPSYWIVSDDDTHYWLLPTPELRVVGTILDSFQCLFNMDGLPNNHGFRLVKPALVQKAPNQTWQLCEKGDVVFAKSTETAHTEETIASPLEPGQETATSQRFQQELAPKPNPLSELALPTYWVSLGSILILGGLALYYHSIQQLNSLEIFWLTLIFITCTIPSLTTYHHKPSFPNVISAIGVPFLGIINAVLNQGSLQEGWWLLFFIAFWLLILAQQSRKQNSLEFYENIKGNIKPVNINNLIALFGFFMNAAIVANYAPAYHYFTVHFMNQQNKGLELFGTIMGGLGFLLWSSFSFYYSSTIYRLAYNKNWSLKLLIAFGLPVLGIFSIFRDSTNFFANWWLVFGLGFVLVYFILTPAVRKAAKS
jgi:Pentapeptide repeats (8 copies)